MVALLYYVYQSKPGSLLTVHIYRQDFRRSPRGPEIVLSRTLRLVTAGLPDFSGDNIFIRGGCWNQDARRTDVTPDYLRLVFEAVLFGTPEGDFPKAFGPMIL